MLVSAGRGIQHAERGHADALTRVVTIWVEPRTRDTAPRHAIVEAGLTHEWQLIAADRDARMMIDQDARVSTKRLVAGEHLALNVSPDRVVYLMAADGELMANDHLIGAAERIIARHGQLRVTTDSGAGIVLVSLPAPRL